MHCSYSDITSKLGEPLWWDEEAVPRYCEFSHDKTANIYTDEVILMEIACQECGHRFKVAMSYGSWDMILERKPLVDRIKEKSIHYGDPPNYCTCSAGATMNCIDVKILQYWKRENWEWKRYPEYEIEIEGINEWFD